VISVTLVILQLATTDAVTLRLLVLVAAMDTPLMARRPMAVKVIIMMILFFMVNILLDIFLI
jgi:hypothetical protein